MSEPNTPAERSGDREDPTTEIPQQPGADGEPPRLRPRPLERPPVDPDTAAVFGRPSGIDGGFAARLNGSLPATPTGLVVVLHSGIEVTLGSPTDLLVKLAVAANVAPLLDDGMPYLDVSVPERPVASRYLNSQVESESSAPSEP